MLDVVVMYKGMLISNDTYFISIMYSIQLIYNKIYYLCFSHYLETSHCYSMNLGNNRVWDYVGDNYVHRLVQNKGDGKLVEGSSPGKLDVNFIIFSFF